MDEYQKTIDGRLYMVRIYPRKDAETHIKCWLSVGGDGKVIHWRQVADYHVHVKFEIARSFAKEIAKSEAKFRKAKTSK